MAAVPGEPSRTLSEHSAIPACVVVHDPGRSGALDGLRDVPADELAERCLFREAPDPERFSAEHDALVTAIEAAGIEVVRLGALVSDPELARNPNHVYTRDSVITLPWLPGRYVRGSMRAAVRRPEPAVTGAALDALGLSRLFAAGSPLEGGDVIPVELAGRRTLLVGFGPRTTWESVDALWRLLAPQALDSVVAVRLAEWRLNLDGALVPAAADTVVAQPESIEAAFLLDERGSRSIDVLEHVAASGMAVLEVSAEEAMELQACNLLCLGGGRLVCYDLAPRVLDALRGRGLDVRTIPASELIKGTGGPRCMTRPVYEPR